MARPKRKRMVCWEPDYIHFQPDGISPSEQIILSVDEYEVIRLVDFEKKTHEETARQMQISRTTVTEIYESARFKLADCIVNGKQLRIAGGPYQLCQKNGCCRRGSCRARQQTQAVLPQKGRQTMRIAVTYENGQIFQHFGHTEAFKIYDVENGAVQNAAVVPTNGSGHGTLAGFLSKNGVDTLICGGIGGGAQMALATAGIQLYGGVAGDADEAVQALLAGTLGYNPNVRCSHHDHEHGEGHTCGQHGCGNHGCH